MASTISADSGLVSGIAGIKYTSDSSGVLALQTGNNTTALTVDTSGNALLGTTTTPTSTTYGGQFVTGGVGIYPWTIASGATNSTIYSTLNVENATIFSGNNGTTNQSFYSVNVSPKISNTGAGGNAQITVYGVSSTPTIQSSSGTANLNIYAGNFSASRTNTSDTSNMSSTSAYLVGVNASAVQSQTISTTLYNLYGLFSTATLGSGNATSVLANSSNLTVGNSNTVAASALYAWGFRLNNINVGTAAGASATLNNLYGYGINSVVIGASASVTNYYAFYLPNPTVTGTLTNRWAIYSSDTGSSYFAGKIGLGTTSPQAPLHVVAPSGGGLGSSYGIFDSSNSGSIFLSFYNSGTSYGGIGSAGSMVVFTGGSNDLGLTSTNNIIFGVNGSVGSALEKMRLDTSGRLLIGNTSATGSNYLQVNSDALINGLTVGLGPGAVGTNTVLGIGAESGNSYGNYNTVIGYQAGYHGNSAELTAVGYQASYSDFGFYNSTFGYQAGYSNTYGGITAFGFQAGYSQTGTVSNNTALGYASFYSNVSGGNNTGVGYQSGYNTTGGSNVFLGYQSGYSVTSGANNVILGNYTGSAAPISATGSNYIVMSDGAGNVRGYFDGSGNLLVGTTTGFTSATYNVGGALVNTGYSVYPYINYATTNTANYVGITYQNSTVFSGNNGSAGSFMYGMILAPQTSNTGAGGTTQVSNIALELQPQITSSGSNAYVTGYGIQIQFYRNSATDTSSFGSNFLEGIQSGVGHNTSLSSSAVTGTVYNLFGSSGVYAGTVTNNYTSRSQIFVGSSTAVTNTCLLTNNYNYYTTATVGAASGSTGTVTNYYDIYLSNPTINATGAITNKWAIYSANSGNSYFAGNIGIGTTTPTSQLTTTLDVSIHGLTVGLGGGSIATNTAVGTNALSVNTTASYNTAVGYRAVQCFLTR